MRSRIGLMVAWLAVTATGIGVASAAVQSVRSNVTEAVAPSLRIVASASAAPAASTTTTATPPPETSVQPGERIDQSEALAVEPTEPEATTSTVSTAAPPTTTTSAPESSSGTQQSDPATPPPTATTSTTSTTAVATATTIRSFELTGGSVTIEVGPRSIRLLGAVPNPGFTAKQREAGNREKVVVVFKSTNHESRLTAELNDGVLVTDRDEEPNDDS